ncbi:type II toxin-antitoxin system Phd/YefM family antitoxin [Demetria terragena]|uniref:type II toxin-antitoxin system Phd/YefM family antitoxin n=1 Tax=Demetria terragena TaxID=63959 RepID=UPI000364341F|nr:type II toxin-antitoxin system prevent-host-death family antitoxin [Demetria terragena]
MNVGVRELRDTLSRRLAEVREGHTITVTDHGRAVARIVPVDGPTRLEQLIAEGLARPANTSKQQAPPPIRTQGTVSDLIDDQRR